MKCVLFACLAVLIAGCETKEQSMIRYCQENNIPYRVGEPYTSPRAAWEQKTREISDKSGVPLERVRSLYAKEGRDADESTILESRVR